MEDLLGDADPAPAADAAGLTITELAEFAACSRAGLLLVETRGTPDVLRPPPIHLDFSRPYTREDLDRQLQIQLNRVWVWSAASVLVLAAVVITYINAHQWGLLFSGALLIVLARQLGRPLGAVQELIQLRATIPTISPSTFEPASPEAQHVDWWGLLNAGWMSDPLHEAYRDDTLPLEGRPWRVLRRGSFVLPVFKERLDLTDPWHVRRREVRAAAACELVRRCEGAQAPCAILLHADTYAGRTIPNPPNSAEAVQTQVELTHQVLSDVEVGRDPPPPASASGICGRCRWGAPRVASDATETICSGEPLPVYGTAKPGALYHSPCGDRFRWVPPHERARQLGLT